MYLGMCLLKFILPKSLCFLELADCFLFHIRNVCSYYLFKYFLKCFLSLSSFWNLYNVNFKYKTLWKKKLNKINFYYYKTDLENDLNLKLGVPPQIASNTSLLFANLYVWCGRKGSRKPWNVQKWETCDTPLYFSSVQSLTHIQVFVTPWTAAHQASQSITNSQDLLKLMSIESVMPSNYLILCHPLFLLPSIFPSIRVFSNESVLHIRWAKYWSFSFSISPSNEYSGLIPLGLTGWISLQSKGLSRVFSNTTVQKHQFFSAQLSL